MDNEKVRELIKQGLNQVDFYLGEARRHEAEGNPHKAEWYKQRAAGANYVVMLIEKALEAEESEEEEVPAVEQYSCQHGENKADCPVCNPGAQAE